ncbi:hypothetical protein SILVAFIGHTER_55 [Mycobacterium phage Silvafighter]|nr:hypothetical protein SILVAFIGHTER_55 [Mycobacterium phage Silvafighter]
MLMDAYRADRNNVDDAMLTVLGLAGAGPGRCATSLDEFTAGQHVKVVVGMGCVKPGVVEHVGPNKVEVVFDGGRGLYRPYELIPGALPVGQLDLFEEPA